LDQKKDFNLSIFIKNNWNWILLILILFFGFYLRVYHLNYPVVGYHNWKETHYLSEARNFAREGFFEHGFFVPSYDYPDIQHHPSGVHGDTFPTISILSALSFKIFGFKLWAARIISILFNTASILLIYFITKKLFKRETISLITAFVFSTTPLFVFFSHNVQLMNVAIFFFLLSFYLFFLWKEKNRHYLLIFSAISLTIAGLTKYPFLIGMIPIAFSFPYKRLKNKKLWKTLLICFLISLTIPIWMYYTNTYLLSKYETKSSITPIKPTYVFTSDFISASKNYIKDNFTALGFIFSILGALIFLTQHKRSYFKFVFGYLIAVIIFTFIMASKMSGHSYHYYPIAPFFILMIGYFITISSNTVKNFFAKKIHKESAKIFIILILLFFLLLPSLKAKNRQFNTQFYGIDTAGEYVDQNKEPRERAMHSKHQAFGFLWHADIKGTRGIPKNTEEIQYAEQKLNATWLFIYQWDLNILQEKERGDYIKDNYALKQAGFIRQQNQQVPLYLLFKKSPKTINQTLDQQLSQGNKYVKIYEKTSGKVPITIVET